MSKPSSSSSRRLRRRRRARLLASNPPLPELTPPHQQKPSSPKAKAAIRKSSLGEEPPIVTIGTDEECPVDCPVAGELQPAKECHERKTLAEGKVQRKGADGVLQDASVATSKADAEMLPVSLGHGSSHVRRSVGLRCKFRKVLTQASFLRDLEQSYATVAHVDKKKKGLHIRGERENVLACIFYIETVMEEWQRRLDQCADGTP